LLVICDSTNHFKGDAVIIYWKVNGTHTDGIGQVSPKKPVTPEYFDFELKQTSEECEKGEIVLKAANCCLELLKRLGTYTIDIEDCSIKTLRIHLGIGAGQIFDVHVGEGDRWEHFIAGDGINQLSTVLDLAKAGIHHLDS
jgi:hypothetical protein